MPKEWTPEQRQLIQAQLKHTQDAQSGYWEDLRVLELLLGGDIDGLDDLDLSNQTVDSIMTLAEEQQQDL